MVEPNPFSRKPETALTEATNKIERTEYRVLMAQALAVAMEFDGSAAATTALLEHLSSLERRIQDSTFSDIDNAEGDKELKEMAAAYEYDKRPKTINDVLVIAGASQQRALRLEQSTPPYVLRPKFKGVFLPPGEKSLVAKASDNTEHYEVRFDDILNELVTVLRRNKVFSDDLIITSCEEPTREMWRSTSYLKVEIPRLGKTVLLCSQVNEATFVIQGSIPDEALADYTKADLMAQIYPTRQVRRGPHWADNITKYLFSNDDWPTIQSVKVNQSQVNVVELEQRRQFYTADMQKQYTAEQWSTLKFREAQTVKTNDGKGLQSLATIFGTGGKPI